MLDENLIRLRTHKEWPPRQDSGVIVDSLLARKACATRDDNGPKHF